MYQKVLNILVSLHADATYHLSECPLLQRRTFDYGHLRWETSYFLDRFALGIKGVNRTEDTALEMEFDRLAKKVDAYHKTIVHRDFQSQNIMIVKDEIPRLIDYQSARVGPPAYDLASILWDPYVRIDEGMRGRLIDYYVQQVKGVRHDFDESEFIQSLLPCRMQRHMQALGAYGFLSKVKGKNYFLKHVKQALEYLKVLDRSASAFVALGADLRIVNANAAGKALEDKGVAQSRDGRWRFLDNNAQALLEQLCAAPAEASAAFTVAADGAPPYAALAIRIEGQRRAALDGFVEGAAMLLTIARKETAPTIPVDHLAACYGLTPTEAKLASALADGSTLQAFARYRGVTEGAARFLLKGILRKTETADQARLVAALRALPAQAPDRG